MNRHESIDVILGLRCPTCGKTEGYLGIGKSRWGYCQTHKFKWIAGWVGVTADDIDRGMATGTSTEAERGEEERRYNELRFGEFEYVGPDAEEYERWRKESQP